MNLSLKIARRYLFARKSTNAINIISGVAVFGIAVGAGMLILILSVFNGFEDLLTGLFGAFNPPIKVTPVKGKTFVPEDEQMIQLHEIEGIGHISQTLEEISFFEYKNVQDFGMIKGVDSLFKEVVGVDSTVVEGKYRLKLGNRYTAVLGSGVRNKLSVNVRDQFSALRVYTLKRKNVGPLGKPYRSMLIQPIGTFFIQQEFDQRYILTDIKFARELLGYDKEVSSLEISVKAGVDVNTVKKEIKSILGPDFLVKDRYEQDEAFLKLMKVEKWMGFAILSFMMVLVAFNMIGSLWMIVLDKRKDIAILKSMGATSGMVRNIFLLEGLLLCTIGLVLGFAWSMGIYSIQKFYGLVPIPTGFIINAYPISLRAPDFVLVIINVLIIGLLASLPAANRAARVEAVERTG